MADDFQEKTEKATPKRIQDAREEGQLPRSRELNGLAMLLTGSAGLLVVGAQWADHWRTLIESIWRADVLAHLESPATASWLAALFSDTLLTMAPWLLVMYLVAFVAPMLLSGWSFSAKSLGFKIERLNPGKGLKRMFGTQGLVELFKALAKFVLVSAIALAVFWQLQHQVMGLGLESNRTAIAHSAWLVGITFVLVSCAMVLIAAIDVPFQIWQHGRNLRMSRQQIKDEQKQTDGDPHLKARIRQTQREMARARMMSDVPTADVIVTNPEHYAVALRYDMQTMAAPVVVAKGVDHLAATIRQIGGSYKVPVVRSPLLARTTYYSTEIGAPIPHELYLAVAQILAYIYELEQAGAGIRGAKTGAADGDVPGADEVVPAAYASEILTPRGKL